MKEKNLEIFEQALQMLDKRLEIMKHPKIVIRAKEKSDSPVE